MKNKKSKKALIISGGGAFGAWGGGIIHGLYKKQNKEYDLFVGTSTGSLLSPLSSIKEMDRLKEAYTSVTQKDIFNVNPFNRKGRINFVNFIVRVTKNMFTGKHITLGESENLKKTIKKFFKQEDFDRIKKENKEVFACVSNITKGVVEYKSSNNYQYEDFVDWLWTSSCVPVFMSTLTKEGCEYVDGGIMDHIPIQKAIDENASEIDIIVHRPIVYTDKTTFHSKNVINLFTRITDIMHREISRDDIAIAKLILKEKDVKITVYYTPYKLSENSLMFDKKIMQNWWNMAYDSVGENDNHISKYVLSKSGLKKV